MKFWAKKLLIFFALLSKLCVAQTVGAQGGQPTMQSATPLPTTCRPGTATQAADMIVASGAEYLCTATNTWSIVGPAAGLDTTWLRSLHIKGPVPWADVTAFGVKAYPPSYGGNFVPGASCNRTTTVKMPSNISFSNGDGLVLLGCGPSNLLTTPLAPTVTPSTAIGGTLPESDRSTPGATGRSTYRYAVAAIDARGGVSAASPITTIINGNSSLGERSMAISRATRSDDTVTYTTAYPHDIEVGTVVHVSGMTPTNFDYWGTVYTTSDNTHFSVRLTGFDTRQGLPTSSIAGGTAVYFTENFVTWPIVPGAWQYAIYGERPGGSGMKLLYVTPITAPSGFPFFWYSDFGAMMNSNLKFLPWIPTTAPSIATNDYLSSTVVSGGGTTTLVLATSASQTVSNTYVAVDDAPNILNAANSVSANSPGYTGGTIYFPPTGPNCYIINSYLKLPATTNVKGAGSLCAYATIQIQGNSNWDGSWASPGAGSFTFSGRQIVRCYVAPCIFTSGMNDSYFSHVSISSSLANGDILWQANDNYEDTWSDVSFTTGQTANTDYFGVAFLSSSTSSGGNPVYFDHVSVTGGPDQVTDKTWAPLMLWTINRNSAGSGISNSNDLVSMRNIFFTRRGIEHDNYGGVLGYWDVDWLYRQGGITPFFSYWGGGGLINGLISIKHSLQDTETSPLLAFWDNIAQGGSDFSPGIILEQVSACGQLAQLGSYFPLITGQRSIGSVQTQVGCGLPMMGTFSSFANWTVAYPWETSRTYSVGMEGHYNFAGITHVVPPYELIIDLAPPTNIAATASTGGSMPRGAYTYVISSVDVNGGEGLTSYPTRIVTTTTGSQTVNLAWTARVGAASYNIYRCNSSGTGCTRVMLHQTGTVYRDNSAGTTGHGPPQASGAGSTVISGVGVQTIQGQVFPQKFATLSPCTNALEGAFATVTDSMTNAWGVTVTGGGSDVILAFCNGTRWTVYGK